MSERVIFPRDEVNEKLSEREKEIINLIIKNPKISRAQLSKIIGINQSAIQKQIDKIKNC